MKQVQINHATLVALQGRLRRISESPDVQGAFGEMRYDAAKAIQVIDDWLIDPAMQVPICPECKGTRVIMPAADADNPEPEAVDCLHCKGGIDG